MSEPQKVSSETLYRKVGRRYVPVGPPSGEFTAPMPVPYWLIVDGFRYACGRCSTQPAITSDWLIAHWQSFPEAARSIIRRDLEREFDADDVARRNNSQYKPLGWDCDRESWERVRALWADKKEID